MRTAIIGGGQYRNEISVNAARHLYNHLYDKSESLHMVTVDREGQWHNKGLLTDMHKVLPKVDNVIDLRFGKRDADEARLIKSLKLTDHLIDNYDNEYVKKLCHQLDIDHNRYFIIRKEEKNINIVLHKMWRKMHLPVRIIPNSYNNSSIITYEYGEVLKHVKYLIMKNEDIVIEEITQGVRFKVLSIRNFRNKSVYITLPHAVNNIHNKGLNV
jgi:hypothetical protein